MRRVLILGVVGAVALTAGVALATSDGSLAVCYKANVEGQMRAVTSATDCKSNEVFVNLVTESALDADIAALQAQVDALVADNAALAADLAAEQAAREAADALLQDALDDLAADLAAEAAARADADDQLAMSLDAEIARATGAEDQLAMDLDAEAAARLAADAQLIADLADEIAARAAADSQLQNDLAQEAAARAAADSQLQNDLAQEAAARMAADSQLQNDLAQEAAARAAADGIADTRLGTLETDVTAIQALLAGFSRVGDDLTIALRNLTLDVVVGFDVDALSVDISAVGPAALTGGFVDIVGTPIRLGDGSSCRGIARFGDPVLVPAGGSTGTINGAATTILACE